MIIATLNRTSKEKLQYSGLITFYNAFQNKLLINEYAKGFRIQSGALSLKSKKSIIAKTKACTDWYLVTNYADGRQTHEYLYTTCDDCEEMAYKTLNGCGGGGGGGEGQTNSIFPASPIDNAIVNYFSPEGEHIRYQYINGIWKIILISLPDIVIKTVRESRPYLIFDWPENNQKVVAEGFVYTYDSESGNWEGVPEEVIAQKIEDNIDDSKLDPCPKGIMEKLKNTENKDIASIFNKLEANSIYNVDMKMGSTAQGYAQTQKVSTNNYLITVSNDSYTSSTQLFRAAALIHEIIHAYYHSVVDDNKIPTTTPLNNFPALYQAYELKKYPGGATVAQHNQMAKDYVDAMALTLQEYYISNHPLLFPLASYEVFTDLAWGTLQEASIFNEKYKDDDPAKERILNRYRTESIGQSVETGTIKQQNPIGEPCN